MVWVACLWIEKIAIAVEHRRLPETAEEPLALTNPDGIFQVVSDEAEHWGVSVGMTVQAGRSLCGDLRIFPYDRPAYEIVARPIRDLIATESDRVEPASPEICYVELQGGREVVVDRLRRLVEMIASLIGLAVRAGVARSKFVALRAAQYRLPDVVLVISPGDERLFLGGTPLGALVPYLPKLDLKSRSQLDRIGVKTLGDIWSLPPARLPRVLQRIGYQLRQLAQGFDGDPVRPLWPPRRIVARTSFTDSVEDGDAYSDGVEDLTVIELRLRKMAEVVAEKLGAKHEYAREITLRIGLRDGTFFTQTERLVMPEALASPLHRAGLRQLQRFEIEQPVVLLELIAAELGTGSGVQLSLLDAGGELPHERAKRLEAAIVFLRTKHGPRVVITGAILHQARRVHLWTYSLARYLSEPITDVATDGEGVPVRYSRSAALVQRRRASAAPSVRETYRVRCLLNRWHETGMRHGALTEAEMFRVETEPFGVSDIRRLESEWRLTGIID